MKRNWRLNKSINIVEAAVEQSLSDSKTKIPCFDFEYDDPQQAVRFYKLKYWRDGGLYDPVAGNLGSVKLRILDKSTTELRINDSLWRNATKEYIMNRSYWGCQYRGWEKEKINKSKREEIAINNIKQLLSARDQVIQKLIEDLKNDEIIIDENELSQIKNSVKEQTISKKINKNVYIDINRIKELKKIKSQKYDLTKLICLCEEINKCYSCKSHFAIVMLVRAILDHIPPIFGFTKFSEVVNNYKGARSFKESMKHLNNSCRKIADSYLHVQIRGKEVLPNETQVNFSNDLDFLLAEIVRLLK